MKYLILCIYCFVGTASAQIVSLGDVNQEPRSLFEQAYAPISFAELNGRIYFSGAPLGLSSTLWTSDGSDAGTVMVVDLNSFQQDGVRQVTRAGSFLYFTTANPQNREERLWKSDGSVGGGAQLVMTLDPVSGLERIWRVVEHNGEAYLFIKLRNSYTFEIWKTDGLSVTRVLSNLTQGTGFTWLDDKFIISRFDDSAETESFELRVLDGSPEGLLLTTHAPGFSQGARIGGALIFGGGQNRAIWRTDGTPNGTYKLVTVPFDNHGNGSTSFASCGNLAYFSAGNPKVKHNGAEPWVSDGTKGGTRVLKDIYPDSLGSGAQGFTCFKNLTFFSANNRKNGAELWVSNGTTRGTRLLKDLYPGLINNKPRSSNPGSFTRFGESLVFTATNSLGEELWITNGTSKSTKLLKDINLGMGSSAPRGLLTVGAKLFFTADDGLNGREIWVTDGTSNGTQKVADLALGNADLSIKELVAANSTLYVLGGGDGQSSVTSLSLSSDNNSLQTKSLVNPGRFNIDYSTAANGNLYFHDVNYPDSFWRSESLGQSIRQIRYTRGLDSASLATLGNDAYFISTAGGYKLRKINGADNSGSLITEFTQGAFYSPVRDMTVVDGLLVFSLAYSSGRQLWRSDGTAEGTIKLGDFDGTSILEAKKVGDTFLLGNISGGPLWRSDGTEIGTFPIQKVRLYFSQLGNSQMGSATNAIVFWGIGQDGLVTSSGLWRSDGTENGTFLLAALYRDGAYRSLFASMNGVSYFLAADLYSGYELWRSDGTITGTYMLKDIAPGAASSSPHELVTVNDKVYFVADDGVHGKELWQTDGTADGTSMVQDLLSGGDSSWPTNLTAADDKLFFQASNSLFGRELWVFSQSTIDLCPSDPLKNAPGVCGCENVDSFDDLNNNSVPDCRDWRPEAVPPAPKLKRLKGGIEIEVPLVQPGVTFEFKIKQGKKTRTVFSRGTKFAVYDLKPGRTLVSYLIVVGGGELQTRSVGSAVVAVKIK